MSKQTHAFLKAFLQVFILLFSGSKAFSAPPASLIDQIEVAKKTFLFAEKSSNSQKLLGLGEKVQLRILKNKAFSKWAFVVAPNKIQGWVFKAHTDRSTIQPIYKHEYTLSNTAHTFSVLKRHPNALVSQTSFVHQKPHPEAQASAKLRRGLRVVLLKQRGRWTQIRTPHRRVGWILSKKLRAKNWSWAQIKKKSSRKIANTPPPLSSDVPLAKNQKEFSENEEDLLDSIDQLQLDSHSPESSSQAPLLVDDDFSNDTSLDNLETEYSSEPSQESTWSLGAWGEYANQFSHENTNGYGAGAALYFSLTSSLQLGAGINWNTFSETANSGNIEVSRQAHHYLIGPTLYWDLKKSTKVPIGLEFMLGWDIIKTQLKYTDTTTGNSITIVPNGIPAPGDYLDKGLGLMFKPSYRIKMSSSLSLQLFLHYWIAFHGTFSTNGQSISGQSKPQQLGVGIGFRWNF